MMPRLKTPLLQTGEDEEGHLGRLVELSLFSKLLELREDCHLYKKMQMARNACFCLTLNPLVFFTTAVACGVLNYLVWTRVSHMSVSLTLPFPFCLSVLCCWRYEHPRMMLKSK